MRLYIGIDDTDNLDSRGTGFRARDLIRTLAEAELAEGVAITRHQLLVDPRIRYTSHNSSACLEVEAPDHSRAAIEAHCRGYLERESAPGSDAGLCVGEPSQVTAEITTFGARAKTEVVAVADAVALASSAGMTLVGLTGTGEGVIGALAAVGLRAGGDDGRYLWSPSLREVAGTYTVAELERVLSIGVVETADGRPVSGAARINVGEWLRPILRDGRPLLLVEESQDGTGDWQVASKDLIKRRSE